MANRFKTSRLPWASPGIRYANTCVTQSCARCLTRDPIVVPSLIPGSEQVKQWIEEDHCYNCEAMLPRLLEMGYKGSLSVLKKFVHPLRPATAGHYPVVRYETKPGEQVQFDWGMFQYEQDGAPHKFYGLYVRYNQRIGQELTPLPDLRRNTGKICLPHLGGTPHDRNTLATVPTGGITRPGAQVAPETSSLATCTCHD